MEQNQCCNDEHNVHTRNKTLLIMPFHTVFLLITSLAKEVMFLVALVSLSVCLFVCLSVDNITQKVMNGLG